MFFITSMGISRQHRLGEFQKPCLYLVNALELINNDIYVSFIDFYLHVNRHRRLKETFFFILMTSNQSSSRKLKLLQRVIVFPIWIFFFSLFPSVDMLIRQIISTSNFLLSLFFLSPNVIIFSSREMHLSIIRLIFFS